MPLDLLSAGAAKGLVQTLEPAFRDATGATVAGTFGAVGAIREKLAAGAPCDCLILTAAMLDELARTGVVVAETIMPLGRVRTGVACRSGAPVPDVTDRTALQRAFAGARALYFPDPERATAGIHFMKVLRALDLADALAPRLRPFPNGAAAMAALAADPDDGAIGCTQLTEILYTPGVTVAGPLPKEFELATIYAVAVPRASPRSDLACRFAALLAGESTADVRARAGFEP